MKTFRVASLIVAIVALGGTARAGSIKGSVRYAGGPLERKKVAVTIDQYLCGKEKTVGDLLLSPNNGIHNVVVSLQGVPGRG